MAPRLDTRELKETVPGFIRTTRFFNGRLLTAEDLEAEQRTRQAQRLQLARALGEGVAFGLEVREHPDSTVERPVVSVEPGLAISAAGTPVELARHVDLALLRPADEGDRGAARAGGLFADCSPAAGGVYTVGRAVYLLVASPGETMEGRVTAEAGSTARCGPLAVVEGVRFRLVDLGLEDGELLDGRRLRNRVAHKLLGTGDPRLTSFWSDPRGPVPRSYGLLDDLRSGRLGADDVPLATIGWRTATSKVDEGALRGAGIQFVDAWSARRGLAFDEPRQHWPLLTGRRRRVETQAAFFQFADEIEDLVAADAAGIVSLAEVTASSRFAYLPAVGMLPLQARGRRSGFGARTFFGRQALPELATLDAEILPSLVQEGLLYEPVEVDSADRVQLYVVWENVTAGPLAGLDRVPEAVLVFAKTTIPYRGTARFDWAMWEHSRYARSPL
jgi:hypothetical protein